LLFIKYSGNKLSHACFFVNPAALLFFTLAIFKPLWKNTFSRLHFYKSSGIILFHACFFVKTGLSG